jgi:hypothetical protein
MATFAELVADVKIITNRPDLDSETKLAVKSATLLCHHSDYYPKDLYETAILWTPVAYQQSLEYRTLVPRWRAFKHLRKYTVTSGVGAPGDFIEMLLPEQVLDGYGVSREDICYLAGEDIEIRSSTEDTYMLLSCYRHPDITEATYSSWVALDHPYAIEYEAASKIFKMIGWDEQAASMQRAVVEQLTLLRNANILGQGY